MTTPTLLNMTAPCRENFSIPYHSIGDASLDFSLAMVGGIHGNELNGVFVLSRLADYLMRVTENLCPGVSLAKRVLIVPAVNVLGLNLNMRLWPFDKTDIDRMFPGYYLGETTQRIAAAVLSATQSAHYRIDFHASNPAIEEQAHVRLYQPSREEAESAKGFGLNIVERPDDPALSVTLMHAWKQCPGESFILRGGSAGGLQLEYCEKLFNASLHFLNATGILQGEKRLNLDEDSHYFRPSEEFSIISEKAGFFVSKQKIGNWVQTGDLLGMIYDSFTGAIREEIHSPRSGLLLALRRQPLIFEGDLIGRLVLKNGKHSI